MTGYTSETKRAYVERLGATAIDREHEDLAGQLRAATSGGAEVIADVVGGPVFPILLDLLVNGGRFITSGAIAGPEVSLDLRTLYLKHLELIGSTMGTQNEFRELVSLIEQGQLSAQLGGIWPLSQIREAQQTFIDKRFTGKLVLVPDALFCEDIGFGPSAQTS